MVAPQTVNRLAAPGLLVKPGGLLAVLLAIALLAWVPVAAADHLLGGIGHEGDECPPPQECTPGDQGAPMQAPDGADPLAQSPIKQPDLLDRIHDLYAGASSAIGDAAQDTTAAAAAAAAAAGAFVAAALSFAGRPLADLWVSFKPASMHPVAWAGIAAAGTAASAGAIQAGSWLAWRKLAPLLALVPGFSRIAKHELLDNDTRARIYGIVEQNPGIRMGQLAKQAGASLGSTMHHIRKLRCDRLITERPVGRHKCFFVNGSGLSGEEMKALSMIQGDTIQGIADYIQQHPRTNLKDLARGLGISSPLAAHHVGKLERAGLVSKIRQGRTVCLVRSSMPAGASMTSPTATAGVGSA